ncbi:hypothetical protein NP233_g1682 [Leucocoprinus birnbaumii]|uniref:F-box domain-containing protein n=1 Tax=Leucocoprinus birnbaumii TaxID=56174 RepID=A0AAD5W0H0_9AGAR|nr:hypothetical protein NP233_g1682 [Leucocoprinus birnbaumii]
MAADQLHDPPRALPIFQILFDPSPDQGIMDIITATIKSFDGRTLLKYQHITRSRFLKVLKCAEQAQQGVVDLARNQKIKEGGTDADHCRDWLNRVDRYIDEPYSRGHVPSSYRDFAQSWDAYIRCQEQEWISAMFVFFSVIFTLALQMAYSYFFPAEGVQGGSVSLIVQGLYWLVWHIALCGMTIGCIVFFALLRAQEPSKGLEMILASALVRSSPITLMRIIDLPQDILLNIYLSITSRDLLALNQTCRTLHALGTSDYVWHQLNIDLPLGEDQRTHTGQYRPFHEIRRSLLDAFRVEARWGSRCTSIRGLARIDHGDILIRIQLIRQDWLITLSRNQTTDSSYLSAWHLDAAGSQCAAKLSVSGRPNKFAAAVRDEGDSAVIALFDNDKISGVEIFSLSLTNDYMFEDAPVSPLKRFAKLFHWDKLAPKDASFDQSGTFVFFEVQVNNNIVAVSRVQIKSSEPPLAYHIIFIDVNTLAAVVLSKTVAEDVTSSRFIFKLFYRHVAILFSGENEGSIYWQNIHDVFKLCPSATSLGLARTRPTILFMDAFLVLDIEALTPIYTSKHFGMAYEISFTPEVTRATQRTLGLISRRLERLWVFRLSLSPSPPQTRSSEVSIELTSSFSLKVGLNVENLALGRTGYRMVLLERSWETDEYRLKKSNPSTPRKTTRYFCSRPHTSAYCTSFRTS